MTTDQLAAFLAIVKYRSYHLAAEKLFVSQPSLSSRIQALESELDTRLFIREGRGVRLSEQGKSFLPYAKKMIGTYRKARSRLENEE